LFNKIENSNVCFVIQNVTMLIPDLLNIIFDQANYETLTTLKCLNNRKTKYAKRYSVLSHYDVKDASSRDACEKGLIKMVVHITSHVKYDIDSALRHCARLGHLELVKRLISIGAYDKYALGWSVNNGHSETVKYLVSIGADVHTDDDFALRWSANYGHIEIVKYLVSVGADIHAKNDRALDWSAGEGHLEVVKYLVGVGATSDHALTWSARYGQLEVVKYLVSIGADINVNNGELFGIEMIRANFSHLRNT